MKENIKNSFWFNLALVAAVFSVVYIVFFLTLSFLTHHGEEIRIPNLVGKPMDGAINQLHDMHFEVVIDSTFDPNSKPLAVLKQVPDTGSIVKSGRIVMLTVNSITPLRVPMPNLINLSYRSAAMLLKNNKMFLGDTTHVPDFAEGAVYKQMYKGQAIKPGELIPQGSKISLEIGGGLGKTEFDVPDVTHLTVDEALAIINQYNLVPNLYVERGLGNETISDTSTAYVIRQTPAAINESGGHNKINMGSIIDLSIKQNPDAEDYTQSKGNTTAPPDVNTKKNTDEDK